MKRFLFVTGRLAGDSLKKTLGELQTEIPHEIQILKKDVASLMTTQFIADHLKNGEFDEIMIPGLCKGDLSVIENRHSRKAVSGPKDLRDIPDFFGQKKDLKDYGKYHTKILAEIVDAPLLSESELLKRAEYYRESGADVIDIGCTDGKFFSNLDTVVSCLKKEGFQVSVDSFNDNEILLGHDGGADYILSINSQNMHLASRLDCQLVVIPNFGEGLETIDRNIQTLQEMKKKIILDPILNPLNMGFAESISNFVTYRKRYPDLPFLMGIGNLTELMDCDSSGVNAIMAGVTEELSIDYILTTEVANWCEGTVRQFDLARQLMHYAHQNQIVPKNINDSLLVLKERKKKEFTEQELLDLKNQITDKGFRISTSEGFVYIFNRDVFLKGTDINDMFKQLKIKSVSHAYYLGRELMRAKTAVTVGKNYTQEQNLDWGYLTESEQDLDDH